MVHSITLIRCGFTRAKDDVSVVGDKLGRVEAPGHQNRAATSRPTVGAPCLLRANSGDAIHERPTCEARSPAYAWSRTPVPRSRQTNPAPRGAACGPLPAGRCITHP